MTDLIELEAQISAIFRTSENQNKYNQLILERENLLKNQSSSEVKNLEREIDEIKNRQANSGARRYQLRKIIDEKSDAVRVVEPQLDKAQQELSKANFELSFFEQSVSADRMRLNDLLKKLNDLTGATNDETIN